MSEDGVIRLVALLLFLGWIPILAVLGGIAEIIYAWRNYKYRKE